ncbi:hypothetical protein X798_03524 [Onchocerca flexuosa]|uniref:Uncharacterized protein n=2 Tax=Onchocerca flexuosa TaxID=387005 RepID=A0A183H831_9BILA|nr:hypothetical protein X798_03524 [Onchocerca flexuosa]VDO37277.1 unnamed protein product [Onchocerca flexuosa]
MDREQMVCYGVKEQSDNMRFRPFIAITALPSPWNQCTWDRWLIGYGGYPKPTEPFGTAIITHSLFSARHE